jgi:hypothetical protein
LNVSEYSCTGTCTPTVDATASAGGQAATSTPSGANLSAATGTNDVLFQVIALNGTGQVSSPYITSPYTATDHNPPNSAGSGGAVNTSTFAAPSWQLNASVISNVSGIAVHP